MAAKINKDSVTQKSTGAVKFDEAPVVASQPDNADSTGAVEYAEPGETTLHYDLDADAVVRQASSGPVTVSLSWLSDAQAKVVEAPEKSEAKKSSAKVTTKAKD